MSSCFDAVVDIEVAASIIVPANLIFNRPRPSMGAKLAARILVTNAHNAVRTMWRMAVESIPPSCATVGLNDGKGVGAAVGIKVGIGVGAFVGISDGSAVGMSVGSCVGAPVTVGDGLGGNVGKLEGIPDGNGVGDMDG